MKKLSCAGTAACDLLQTVPLISREESVSLEDDDTAPLEFARRSAKAPR